MKYVLSLFLISLVLIYLAIFFVKNQSPFDKGRLMADLSQYSIETNRDTLKYLSKSYELGLLVDYIDWKNFLTTLFLISLSVIFSIATLHSFIDKLFFKKFYQVPNLFLSFLRGIELTTLGIIILILKLTATFDIIIIIPVVVLLLLIDHLIVSLRQNSKDNIIKLEKDEK